MSVGSQGLGKEDAYKHDYFYRTKAAAILGLLTNTSLEWVGQRRSTKEMTSCSYFFLLALGFIRVLHTHTHRGAGKYKLPFQKKKRKKAKRKKKIPVKPRIKR